MKVVALGELLIRLSVDNNSNIMNTQKLDLNFGGAEFNVLAALSNFNVSTKYLTILPDNILGVRALQEISKFNIDTSQIIKTGEKFGTYYLIPGHQYSQPQVIYDRVGSSFSQNINLLNCDCLKAGDILHLSGITPALNLETKTYILNLIKKCHQNNITISYDSNFRSKLWSKEDCGEFLNSILPYIDIAFLGILDLQILLNIQCATLEEGYAFLQNKYPNLKLIASTTRTVIDPMKCQIFSNIFTDKLYNSKTYNIDIQERIGAGDSYTAAVLYGFITEKQSQNIANFAAACTTLKHYTKGDVSFATVNDINTLLENQINSVNR